MLVHDDGTLFPNIFSTYVHKYITPLTFFKKSLNHLPHSKYLFEKCKISQITLKQP
jgi:hypothetical protein